MKIVICICLLAFISGGVAGRRTFRPGRRTFIYSGSFAAQRKREQSLQKTKACLDNYSNFRVDSSSLSDMCTNLKTYTECLRSVVDDYIGDDIHEELKKVLKNVENYYEEACEGNGGDFRKKADICLDKFTTLVENSPEDVCEGMRNTTDCLTTAVDETLGGEDQDAQKTLKRLEEHYNKTCTDREERTEKLKIQMEACLHNYMNSSVSDYSTASNEEKCNDMKEAVECFKIAVNERFGEREEAQDILKELYLVKAYNVMCKEQDLDNKLEIFKKKAEVCLDDWKIDETKSSTEEMCDRMKIVKDCLKRAMDDTYGDGKFAQDYFKNSIFVKYYNAKCKDQEITRTRKKCREDRGESCKKNLIQMMLEFDGNDGATAFNEYLCKSLKTTSNCFQNAVDNCYGDNKNVEIKKDLEELNKLMKEKRCMQSGDEDNDYDNDEQWKRCYDASKGSVIFSCTNLNNLEIRDILERGDMNRNTLTCSLYGKMATCYVGKMLGQCGQKAADYARKEIQSLPKNIAEACAKANIDFQELYNDEIDKWHVSKV